MDKPSVAIIIPCFNHGAYLGQALRSIDEFVGNDVEIIIVNDGSTDPQTIELLKSLKSDNVKVLHQENAGAAAARNLGIRHSSAPFFIPLDADNLLYNPYLKEGLKWMMHHPECAVVFGDARIFGEKEGTWVNHPLRIEEMVFENYIDNCALIRKAAWEQVGGYDLKVPVPTREDYIFWLDLLREGFQFHYLNEFCFGYRYLEGSKVRRYYKIPANRILIQEYIFRKQLDLIQRSIERGLLLKKEAGKIIARHHLQLAHSHLGFGSILKGYFWLVRSVQYGAGIVDVLKSALLWPFRRIRKS
jgi:glycosyltransferase involved in cell wall biosynthesis